MKKIVKSVCLLIICTLLLTCTYMACEPSLPVPPDLTLSPPPDITPPNTTITKATVETVNYKEVTFEWTGSDDITPTWSLTYSYYLEGYDINYSPFMPYTTETYSDLPDGSYTFYVRARDESSNIDPNPASFKFDIKTPPPPENEKDIHTPTVPPIDNRLLIVPGSNVSHIAVGFDNTIYAIDSINAKLYKSQQGGYGWTNKKVAGSATWEALAIAPDDPDVVAIVTDGGSEVYLSIDGGAKFYATGLAAKLGGAERVKCIAISPSYGNLRREITAGTSTGNGGGKIWLSTFYRYSSGWEDISTGAKGWLPTPTILGVDVFSIKYSPDFASDGAILAIVASGPAPNTDDTYLYVGTRDLTSSNTAWNAEAGYPVEICQNGQDTPGTPLTYTDIALPADYSLNIPSRRHVYACWTDNPAGTEVAGNPNDDVYRIDNTVCYRLLGHNEIICSLAHYGMYNRGKLLAGAMLPSKTTAFPGTQVYCTFNPESTSPKWKISQKPPTGPGQARVAWSPDGKACYCGTSSITGGNHTQSAFSVSTNDGLTWNQIGLIDL